jgi:hypothetical protein
MKRSRRIEITAFRRRVTIVSGTSESERLGDEMSMLDIDSRETIEMDSRDGQKILAETIRLLKTRVLDNKM